MNIPKQAQAILRRMKRRGYNVQLVTVGLGGPKPFNVVVEIRDGDPKGGHYVYYECDDVSFLACCRDIEKQWKAEQ